MSEHTSPVSGQGAETTQTHTQGNLNDWDDQAHTRLEKDVLHHSERRSGDLLSPAGVREPRNHEGRSDRSLPDQGSPEGQAAGSDRRHSGLAPLTKFEATLFLLAVAFFAFVVSFVMVGGAR